MQMVSFSPIDPEPVAAWFDEHCRMNLNGAEPSSPDASSGNRWVLPIWAFFYLEPIENWFESVVP